MRRPRPTFLSPIVSRLLWHSNGLLKSGDEFTLGIRQLEQPPDPVFVTLTVLPHYEDQHLWIYAYKPWSCGKLLGFDVPAPSAPEGCAVLGWYEMSMSHLQFTPDNRRLMSIDRAHHVRIQNVKSRELEGQIDLPYLASETVILDRESQTLLAFDRAQKSVQR